MVETVCEGVGLGLAFASIATPAGGVHPLGAIAGGVDVDADEDDVGFAEGGEAVAGVEEDFHGAVG